MEQETTINLPERWRHRVGETVGRQRMLEEEGQLLLILHEVPGDAEKDWFFWIDETKQWFSAPEEGGLTHLKQLLNRYEEVVDSLEARVKTADSVEDFYSILREEAPIGRSLKQVRLIAARTRKICKKHRPLLEIRSIAEELDHDLTLVQDEARLGMEAVAAESAENQRIMSEKQARHGLRLNLLAAFYLPLMVLASLMGMNLRNGFEESRWMFWLIFAIGLGAGGVLVKVVGRDK